MINSKRLIVNAGLKISHVDSHQHLHRLPAVLGIIINIIKKSGINAVRMPHAQITRSGIISRAALNMLAFSGRMKVKFPGENIKILEHFAGIVEGEAVSEKWLCDFSDRI